MTGSFAVVETSQTSRILPACVQLGRRIVLLAYVCLTACSQATLTVEQPPVDVPEVSVFAWETIGGGLEGGTMTGFRDVRFIRPVAVAARGSDVYIVDAGNDQLYRYNRTFDQLTILKDLKLVVKGEVTDIYLASDLSYYIADADGARVLHFDREGRLIRVFEDRINLGRPVAVKVDEATGYVYIADGFNDDVLVYNADGELLGAIGTRGSGEGEFRGITAFDLGPDGSYVATRFGEYRVQHMDIEGNFDSAFQKDTVTFPLALAADSSGRIFVSDYLDNTIKVYVDNRLVETIGGTGSAPGRFKRITDLWLDNGVLYVVDSLNSRIQLLRVVTPAVR